MAKNQRYSSQKVEAPVGAVEPEKIDFESWWALRSPKISHIHHREIIQADFKARGLSENEAMDAYDNALKLYGVSLE